MKKEIICTVCPTGCAITVEGENGVIASVTGNTCPRGEKYARQEFIEPERTLTCSVKLLGAERAMLPIRSNGTLPLAKLFDCMQVIGDITVKAPVKRGTVIVKNILNTGVDMIASMTVEEEEA